METEKKPEKAKKRPKLTRKQMIRIMSRHLVKKQRPILPRTYINTRGLSTARLQPTAPPATEKPIISNNVKARLQSDLQFLLENQHTVDRRIQPAESYFSLQIEKSKLSTNENTREDKSVGKSNTHSSDLAPSSKSDRDIAEQPKEATKSKQSMGKGGTRQSKQPTERVEVHKSKQPTMKQTKQDQGKSKTRNFSPPPSSNQDQNEAVKQKLMKNSKRSAEKEPVHQLKDHNDDHLPLVPYSSSDSKHSQTEPSKRLSSNNKPASKDKAHNSKRHSDDSIGLAPNSIGNKDAYADIPQRPFKRVLRHSSSSSEDSPIYQPPKSKHSSRTHRRRSSEYDGFDFGTVENDIRAGFGSAAPLMSWDSSKFLANRKEWDFDEPKFTEPSSVSSSRFEHRSQDHFGQRAKTLQCRETETTESIESSSSGMRHTQVVRTSLSRAGESPYMEQIVIRKMKHPY